MNKPEKNDTIPAPMRKYVTAIESIASRKINGDEQALILFLMGKKYTITDAYFVFLYATRTHAESIYDIMRRMD